MPVDFVTVGTDESPRISDVFGPSGRRHRIVRGIKRETEFEIEQLRLQNAKAGEAWMLIHPPERQELLDVYQEVAAAGLRHRRVWSGRRAAQAKPVQSVRLDAALKAFLAQKSASGVTVHG